MSSIKKEERKFRNQKNPERKILRRKSKGNFVWGNGLHNKRKSFIKSFYKFGKRQKNCYTHSSPFNKVIREYATCGPRLIFEIKKTSSSSSKVWSRQKNKRENIFLERIYIYIWYCTHNIFNFNKYFICIIFLFILLIL